MFGKLSLLSGVALACGIGLAVAQSSPPSATASPGASSLSPAASGNQGKCFDKVSGQVKDKPAMSSASPGTGSIPNKDDNAGMSSTPPGAAPSGTATTGSASSTAGSAGAPMASPGLPDC